MPTIDIVLLHLKQQQFPQQQFPQQQFPQHIYD